METLQKTPSPLVRGRRVESGWWETWPWRLIQTNLREIDMADIDASRYVDALKALDATVAMINTSGIVASYPTTLEFHMQSSFLHGDDLASIIEACHESGIKVIARTDFSKVRRQLYEQHPDWAYVRVDGAIVDDAGDVHVCPTSAYQTQCAAAIAEETITALPVDGIFFNMAGFQTRDYHGVYHGICHCAGCETGFREMFGQNLPEDEDLEDPVYRRYIRFTDHVVASSKRRMDALIRRVRPDLAIDRPSDARGGFIRQESSTALTRSEYPLSASANTKWVVASLPRTVSSNSSVDFVDYPVRHVSVSPHRQQLRLAQALANGGGLDYYVMGRLDDHADRSAFGAIREIFRYHASNEGDYHGLRSLADVALLTGPLANTGEHRGWFRLLVEHHILFDVLCVSAFAGVAPTRYRTIVVPDLRAVPDDVASSLDEFVASGGTLIATGQTGSWNAELEPREAPAPACLGIDRVREVRSSVLGAYFEVDDPQSFPSLSDTDLIFVDGPYVDATYQRQTTWHLKLVPPGPFGPPERCVLPPATGEPGLAVHPFGEGRALFVPWLCGDLYQRHGIPNTAAFMIDVLTRHAGVEPLGGNLSPMVEVTFHDRDDGSIHLLHLVNSSGLHDSGSFEPVTMRDLHVVLPYEGSAEEVTALVAGRPLEASGAEGRLTVHVPELRLFEAIRIR